MSVVSRGRWQYAFSAGANAEERFVQACNARGYDAIKTPKEVDMFQHIDFWVERQGRDTVGVDVKGQNASYGYWVEIQNVRGNEGWLHGKADWLAFEEPTAGGFLMVLRKELEDWVNDNVEKKFVGKGAAHKKYYQRKGREDIITLLEIDDLKNCDSFHVLKYADPLKK